EISVFLQGLGKQLDLVELRIFTPQDALCALDIRLCRAMFVGGTADPLPSRTFELLVEQALDAQVSAHQGRNTDGAAALLCEAENFVAAEGIAQPLQGLLERFALS